MEICGYVSVDGERASWVRSLIWVKELGVWAHNTDYMAQLLIDAIVDMGGDVTMFNRPDA